MPQRNGWILPTIVSLFKTWNKGYCALHACYNCIKEEYLRTCSAGIIVFSSKQTRRPRMAACLILELRLLRNSWVSVAICVPACEAHPRALHQTSSIGDIPALNQFLCVRMLIVNSNKSSWQFLFSSASMHAAHAEGLSVNTSSEERNPYWWPIIQAGYNCGVGSFVFPRDPVEGCTKEMFQRNSRLVLIRTQINLVLHYKV